MQRCYFNQNLADNWRQLQSIGLGPRMFKAAMTTNSETC